jgi:hypothetical protein
MIIEILTLRIGCIPLFNERFPSMSQYAIEKKALCRWRGVKVPKGRRSFSVKHPPVRGAGSPEI